MTEFARPWWKIWQKKRQKETKSADDGRSIHDILWADWISNQYPELEEVSRLRWRLFEYNSDECPLAKYGDYPDKDKQQWKFFADELALLRLHLSLLAQVSGK